MIDVHCHLLHGVDDGPDTLEESLDLCRIAVADGITRAVVTPHIHPGRWDNTRKSVRQACMDLQRQLERLEIPLQLGFAAEVRLTEEIPEQIVRDEIPFYGDLEGYKIMLMEFPHGYLVPGSQKLAAWLIDHGVRPMIAHPERNRQVMKDPAQMQAYLDLGCWLQVTAGSVIGQFGKRSQSVAQYFMNRDEVSLLASDGHNARARPPVLSKVFDHVQQEFGSERANRLFIETPSSIVASQFN